MKNEKYDLESRTLQFAKNVREFVAKLPKKLTNIDDLKQLVRSSGSVGANYIEANEAVSRKDFLLRIKISRKEAKETTFWLRLLTVEDDKLLEEGKLLLIRESIELTKIFGSIVEKCKIDF